jgi:peptidoglycan-N-acetylmuramic acid deacetylase
MKKARKKKSKNNNILLGIVVVFLAFITWYSIKTYPGTPGRGNTADVQQVQHSENQAGTDPAAGSGGQAAVSSQPEEPAFAGDAPGDRHGWGFVRNEEHRQPEMNDSISTLLSRHGAYWIGSPADKVVYLTFDEGYENGYTASILDALQANNVKAAFFVTGYYLDSQPALVRRMLDEGHIVGNHTDNHPSLPGIDNEEIKKEIRAVEQKYEDVTGRSDMKYFRPPQGEFSERTLACTRDLGYHSIFWSMAFVDWVPLPGGSREAYQSVMDNAHNGALILLHAVSKDNAEAMDKILKGLKAQGYRFGSLDDLVQ